MATENRPLEIPETAPNTAQETQSAFTFGAVDPPSANTTSRRGAERGHARHHNARAPRGRPRATTASNSTEGDTQGTMSTIEPGLFVNNTNLKSDEYMHLCAEINKLKRDLAYMKKTIYTTYAAAGNTQAPTPTPTPATSATSATTTTTSPTPKVHLSKHAVSFAHGEAPDTPLGKPRAEVTIFSAPHTVGEFPNLTPQVRAQAAQ